jgi:hypothetical protein
MRRDVLLVAAVALVANITYLIASNGDYVFPDSYTYLAPARQLLAGHGFVSEPDVPETIRTPVYPLLLLPFVAATPSVLPVVIVQHLLNVLLAAWVYLFCRRRLSRFAAVAAGLLVALDVPTIHYANKVLTETPFTLLLFASFLLALERRQLTWNAILCGVLVLLRPVAIFWFAVLALYYVVTRVPWRRVAAFAAIALVLPLAWGVRNGRETGVYTISSIGGTNLLFYRAAGALAVDEGDELERGLARAQAELKQEAFALIRTAEEVDDPRTLDHAVQAKYFSRVALETIRENKVAFLQLSIRGLLVNLLDSDWESVMMVSIFDSSIIRMLLDLGQAAFLLLALIGFAALWRRDRPLALLAMLTAGYFVIISAGGESEARFRVPVVPQLAIAAGAGLEAVRRGQLLAGSSKL